MTTASEVFSGLRPWIKGGIVGSGLHFGLYFIMLILFWPLFGLFIVFLEYPWASLYHVLGFPGDLLFFPFDLLIGTIFYFIVGAMIALIISLAQNN